MMQHDVVCILWLNMPIAKMNTYRKKSGPLYYIKVAADINFLAYQDNTCGSYRLVVYIAVVRSELDADVLLVREELEREPAALRADAALLDAAEGHAKVTLQPAVDPDHARLPLLREAVRALEVRGEERAREPVARGVDVAQHLCLVGELVHHDHGPEDLLLRAARVGGQPGYDRRRDEEALLEARGERLGLAAAAEDLAALLLGHPDVVHDLVEVELRDDGAEVGRRGVAGDQRARGGDELVEKLVVDGGVDKDARAGETDLALVSEGRACGDGHGLLEVGVVKYHRRVLAAQLQGNLLEEGRGNGGNSGARGRATGERDKGNVLVRDKSLERSDARSVVQN